MNANVVWQTVAKSSFIHATSVGMKVLRSKVKVSRGVSGTVGLLLGAKAALVLVLSRR